MSLIEGVGDEVTLVLGGCLLFMVLVLAWFSTHTADIPLLREMGVIVVELSQRRSRTRVEADAGGRSGPEGQDSDAQQSAGGEAVPAQTSEESVGRDQDNEGNSLSSSISGAPNCTSSGDNAANMEEAAHREPDLETSTLPQTAEHLVASFESEERRDDSDVENLGNTDSLVPPASVTVGLNESGGQALAAEAEILSEEEVRRRRVQYFQTPSHPVSTGLSGNNTSTQSVGGFAQPDSRDNAVSRERSVVGGELGNSTSLGDQDLPSDAFSENIASQSEEDISSRIRVKLKYMNETQRLVYASPYDTIGDFRRTHFQSELEDNKWVRFIYNGQDLRDDARTLQACNIEDNSTMHCLITAQARARPTPAGAQDEEDDSFFGAMMYPMFTLLLVVVWYLRFTYRQYFSAMSTVCLLGISFLLGLSYISSLRGTGDQRQTAQAAGGSATGRQQNHPHAD